MEAAMINQPRSYGDTPFQAWWVTLSSALFFFFVFMQVNMFNALAPALINTFHIDAAALGKLSASYFYATVLFLFPAGMILDRYSTRKIIITAMFVTVACTYWFALAPNFGQAFAARFIVGICGAFCLLSSVRLASRWFPPQRMALVVGLIVTMAMIGGMVAQTPLTVFTDHFGWRKTMVYDATLGLLILFIIFWKVKDHPAGREHLDAHHALKWVDLGKAIAKTVTNPQNWLAGLYTSLMNLPVFLLGAVWGVLYLTQIHHFSRADASMITSMIFFGLIFGSPLVGWISDRLCKRKLPMISCAIISIALIFLIMYVPHFTFSELIVLFFLLGLVISGQIISYALIAESNPRHLTGAAEGLGSVIIMSGGFTIQVFPMLLDLNWNHSVINQIPQYSLRDFHLALMIMPVAFVLSLIIALMIRETNCKSVETEANSTYRDQRNDSTNAKNNLSGTSSAV